MDPSTHSTWRIIIRGDIVLPGGNVLKGGTVVLEDGLIHSILEHPPDWLDNRAPNVHTLNASGCWVTPGLIDQHLHGAFGVDFNLSNIPAIQRLLTQLPQHGITSILPTVMTAPKLDMMMALANLEEVILHLHKHQARVLGIHLEGPFLNPQYKGAHPTEDLLRPSAEALDGLLSAHVKRMTLAPELDIQFQTIRTLTQQGVLCSMGHSAADAQTAQDAVDHGINCVTHLFNAMSRMHHRDPGMVATALLNNDVYTELICDGKHITPMMIQLASRLKPLDKLIAISDCNALTGLPPGTAVQFGKQTITVQPEGTLNEEGQLAGSSMLITDCIRQLVHWGVLPFEHAIQLGTLNPATYLGEAELFGQIAPRAMADIVLWQQADLSIEHVLLSGETVYDTPAIACD